MDQNKYLTPAVLAFFLTGCAGLTKNQAAVFGAATCGILGRGAGASVGNNVGNRMSNV